MSNEQRNFLHLPRNPALLTQQEVCWLLGLALHQGQILVRKGMLIPTGKRRRRKGRLFATAYILELVDDQEWLSKAKDTLSKHWEEQHELKKIRKAAKLARQQ